MEIIGSKTEQTVRHYMLKHYVNYGKVPSFQTLQDFLASIGYSFYWFDDKYSGKKKKKLKIRRKLHKVYKRYKKNLPKMAEKRERILKVLDCAKENLDRKELKAMVELFKDDILAQDRENLLKKEMGK